MSIFNWQFRSRDSADKSHLILAKDKKANFQLKIKNLPEMFKENSVDPHEANPTMTLTNDEQQNLGSFVNLCDYPTTHILALC